MTRDELFESLTENALDFLDKAIEELAQQPKYSVISFYTAVELLIKARLLAEHWTLIVAQRGKLDWSKFSVGDFESVNLEEAGMRLKNVVDSPLSRQEIASFDEVRRHRNKIIHFFHEAHTDKEKQQIRQEILKQQLTAWYFLERLLIERWIGYFGKWTDRVRDIGEALRRHQGYLTVVFENLKDQIEAQRNAGMLISICPSCSFDAQMGEADKNVVYQTDCAVCGLSGVGLRIDCYICGSPVVFENEGFSTCPSCSKKFEPDDLVSILGDETAMHQAAMDGDTSWDIGNCAVCDGYHTIVRIDVDEYVCTSCLHTFANIGVCEWCDEPNSGDMTDSYLVGCNQCDGRAGWDKDE